MVSEKLCCESISRNLYTPRKTKESKSKYDGNIALFAWMLESSQNTGSSPSLSRFAGVHPRTSLHFRVLLFTCGELWREAASWTSPPTQATGVRKRKEQSLARRKKRDRTGIFYPPELM
jgi:hypothetical protein